jgi:hypothetical protein
MPKLSFPPVVVVVGGGVYVEDALATSQRSTKIWCVSCGWCRFGLLLSRKMYNLFLFSVYLTFLWGLDDAIVLLGATAV